MNFDTVIIRSNPITYDPRVIKISQSLSKKYSVIILGWDREMINEAEEVINNKLWIKRLKLKAPYGRFSLLSLYPLFWIWVFINLITYKPRVVHACDLDSLIPCYVYRKIFSTKLLFDSFDRFAMAFVPQKHYTIYTFIDKLENLLSSKSDALVTVSDDRLLTFSDNKPNFVEIIYNSPSDNYYLNKSDKVSSEKDNLHLVYAGSLASDRGLFLLDEALHDLKGVRLILAGRADKESIEPILQNPNIKHIGLLGYDSALKLQATADIIPILYDPSVPINCVASPNKLFEAMMLGIPVITNVCEDLVEEIDCGLIVEYNSKSVREQILLLKNDPALRKKLGLNGRRAFERKYSWRLMEKKLMVMYQRLLDANYVS
ncbi:MAG: glycosyltransferase [Candidatus Bathyarchaeota archaeon]|nr:glycosyltransferase [Candidatus Bathyarchaeum tardum]